jgi:hypothetical protein
MTNKEFVGFPDPLAPESEKETQAYGLSFLKSMYHAWSGYEGQLLNYRRTRYEQARRYAGGYQDTAQYMDLLSVNGDLSYLNLDWSIVPIIPKFIDLVVNSIANYEFTIKARAIDPVSVDKKKKKEMEMKTKLISKNFIKTLQEASGVPLLNDNEFSPESEDEIELFMQLSYKQASEIAIEQGLALAMEINDWKELSKRIIRDLTVLGTAAVKTELDHRGIVVRYVDPIYYVTSYSDSPDYKDVTWAGEVRKIRISELKAEAGDQFTEAQYRDIAKNFIGRNNNPEVFDHNPKFLGDRAYYEYDHFLVEVMEGQFIVPNKIKVEKKYNQYGNYTVHKKSDNYNPPKKSKFKREVKETSYECKYSGKWIIGTSYMYDYGKAKNQIRAKSSLHKTKLDFISYSIDMNRMENLSMCERMIPFGNQIQLIHLKLQHTIAKARPKGMAIEIGALENVPNGKGGTFTALELMDIYDQTGVYFFRYLQDDGSPSQARPVTELEGGIGSAINELLLEYDHNLRMLRDVTGINEAREGSMPDKDSVVGVAKLNLIASNNATKSIHDAYLNIYKRTAESSVLMIQDLVYYDKPYRGYSNAIGSTNMEIIEVGKDVSLHEFGLVIEAVTDEQERATLELDLRAGIDSKEIRPEDAAVVRSIKNTKLATQYMLLKRKQYLQEQMEQAMAQSQANAEQQAVAAERAEQAKVQAAAQLSQLKMQEKEHEARIDTQVEMVKHQHKLEEIELTNEGKRDVAAINEDQDDG